MPEPRKMRIRWSAGRWTARCVPCSLTLSADRWQTVVDDDLRAAFRARGAEIRSEVPSSGEPIEAEIVEESAR